MRNIFDDMQKLGEIRYRVEQLEKKAKKAKANEEKALIAVASFVMLSLVLFGWWLFILVLRAVL